MKYTNNKMILEIENYI